LWVEILEMFLSKEEKIELNSNNFPGKPFIEKFPKYFSVKILQPNIFFVRILKFDMYDGLDVKVNVTLSFPVIFLVD
jgi:hypothetical protein